MLPYFVDEKTDLSNRALLNTLLNEKSVFDKPINPKEGDLLQLSFLVKGDFGRITHAFKFHDGKRIEEEYDAFECMAHHDGSKRGQTVQLKGY